MNQPRLCGTCGVPNAVEGRYCRGCGTFLVEGAIAVPMSPADEAAPSVRGVVWLIGGAIALTVAEVIAGRCGVPSAVVQLADTAITAAVTLALVIAARAEILPLLARTGGMSGAMAAVVALVALVVFGEGYFGALHWFGFTDVRLSDGYDELGWPTWAPYVLLCVAPAVLEELALRGYVMARLAPLLSPTEVLLVQAALFSVMHFLPAIFPSHFVIGVVLGLLRQRTGSLYPGMAVHAAWNARVIWLELHS
jgi:membrane protease YdiL (CAAX protease family)